MDVLEALTFCLERGIAFYVYRLPGENKFCFGAQVDGAVGCWENVKDLEGLDGFVAVPFREDEGVEPLFVRGDVVFEGMTEDGEMLARLQRAKSQKVEYLKPMEGVNREEYLKQAGRMIDALQQRRLERRCWRGVLWWRQKRFGGLHNGLKRLRCVIRMHLCLWCLYRRR